MQPQCSSTWPGQASKPQQLLLGQHVHRCVPVECTCVCCSLCVLRAMGRPCTCAHVHPALTTKSMHSEFVVQPALHSMSATCSSTFCVFAVCRTGCPYTNACTGNVIAPHMVLTATHCVLPAIPEVALPGAQGCGTFSLATVQVSSHRLTRQRHRRLQCSVPNFACALHSNLCLLSLLRAVLSCAAISARAWHNLQMRCCLPGCWATSDA
jgi:hypothetical protein